MSSTAVPAIASFLASEGLTVPKAQNPRQRMDRLTQFSVQSCPEVLRLIGKFCLQTGKYANLALLTLKEYLVMLTYSKMFSLGAGQALTDEATLQSGYPVIRDSVMLLMAQACNLLGKECDGATRLQLI